MFKFLNRHLTTPRRVNVAILVAAVLLPVVGWNYVILPNFQSTAESVASLVAADQLRATRGMELAAATRANEGAALTAADLENAQAALPNAVTVPALLDALRLAASPAVVDSLTVEPLVPAQETVPDAAGLYYQPVSMVVSGSAFDVLAVHERLTESGLTMTVGSDVFTPPGEESPATVALTVYVWLYLGPDTVSAAAEDDTASTVGGVTDPLAAP